MIHPEDHEQERKHERLSGCEAADPHLGKIKNIHICEPEGYEMHRNKFNDNQLESSSILWNEANTSIN